MSQSNSEDQIQEHSHSPSGFEVPAREVSETHTPSESFTKQESIERAESGNLLVLVCHHVALRVGWIFKIETVIMPAFLDFISGQGWVRGCLPWFNRIGQSIPPLYWSERLRQSRLKKRTLFVSTCLMALPFLLLAALWHVGAGKNRSGMTMLFLSCYLFFFSMTGINQLAFGTVQGKLIRPNRRGRLIWISGLIGSLCAILCAWYFLRTWLTYPNGGFDFIFGMTGCCFLVSALLSLLISEPIDEPERKQEGFRSRKPFREAWQLLRDDRSLRNVAIVGMLFCCSLFLMPHYQTLGRKLPGWKMTDLMVWAISQNFSAGIFSLIAGPIADRYGNRITLQILVCSAIVPPLLAIYMTSVSIETGAHYYWVTFLLLGVLPISFRAFSNYVLELCEPEDHPRYLSTLTVCFAVPFCFSPFVGWLVERLGFPVVFLSIAMLVAIGGLKTFTLREPRHDQQA